MTCYYGEELLLPPFQASAQLPKWPSLLFAFNHLSTSSFFHFSLWNLSFGKDTSCCEMRMRTSLLIIFRTLWGERAKKMPDWDMLWSFQPRLLKWSCISLLCMGPISSVALLLSHKKNLKMLVAALIWSNTTLQKKASTNAQKTAAMQEGEC